MKRYKHIILGKKSYLTAGAILGVIWFGVIWGWSLLDITNVDWLKIGDCGTHFYGWMFFKQTDWRFPFGLTDRLTYPYDLSIIYTDSIPLFAILFKLFSPFLPEIFQYFGIWGVMCLILQGTLASLIVYDHNGSFEQNIAISSLAILQPCMIGRMFNHTALAGQWIILLAIYIWLNKQTFSIYRNRIIAWSTATALASMIHIYFIPMIVIIMIGDMIENISKLKDIIKEIILMIISCTCGLTALYLLGAMNGNVMIEGNGLGFYSLNLNTFINSSGWSNILHELPYATKGQYEGFGYIGLGVIALVLFVSISKLLLIRSHPNKYFNKKHALAISFIVLSLIILGMGTIVSFNEHILFTWHYPELLNRLISIFRSSGRMIWPVCYLLIIGAFVIINRILNRKAVTAICLICLILQIWDLSDHISMIHRSKSLPNETLTSDFWNSLDQAEYKLITFVDPIDNTFPFAEIAIENHMYLSDFNASRKNNYNINEYRETTVNELRSGKSHSNILYIFSNYPDDNILNP